ncbi:sigma-54 interaction domain-containing protein [Frisingicoccus sp.]|uniref:sigma-54 interaction domain-containing protein n=1 Tax=Frisingicoccus sp. TaxID=1918627 RepID=UPI002E772780|nr:sigma 54-interacting transcriptional regulator [Frisingicoccus sp.]MEE0752847.1 sigma 54-interacting transcriptional regulator [Frisingicoccus sp.]
MKDISIKEKYEFYEDVFDNMPDALYVLDDKGNMIYVNYAMIKKFDIPRDELLRYNVFDMYDDGLIDYVISKNVYEQKKEVVMCQKIFNSHGKELMQMVSQMPILNDKGDIQYIIGVMRDMEELIGYYYDALNKYQTVKDIGSKRSDDNKLLVYNSPQMSDLIRILNNVAPTDANILVQGESGTGKEVLAEYIHQMSERRDKEMVRINCAAFPETLLESELFGYEKGSFTGALGSGKKGLIETADGSTLFLDEINSLPLALQGKILRTIETKMVQRIGSDRPKKIDFRLIAATNEDLSECIKKKTFRADLYYRLNVIPAIIPPLRDRPSDIEPLIEYFLNKYCKKYGKEKTFGPEAMNVLKNYSWPGNVRELKNFVERIVLISASSVYCIKSIPPKMLNGQLLSPSSSGNGGNSGCQFDIRMSLEENLNAFEKQIIESVVQQYGSGKSAAEVLRVNQSTISRKMAKYNISI